MSEPTTAHDDIIRKVQALIAKAESTEFGPERDAFRAKADQLVARYAIEQYQLDEALRLAGKAPSQTPVVKSYAYPYAYGTQGDLARYIDRLFQTICTGIGVRKVYDETRAVKDEAGKFSHHEVVWKVVGYEADIAYLDLLFMSLQLQMFGMLEPEPTPAISYDANVHALHDAGVKWETIARRMNTAITTRGATWDWTPWDLETHSVWSDKHDRYVASQPAKDGGRLIRAYKRECKRLGLAPIVVTVSSSYREDFVWGFCWAIARRMRDARSEAGGELVLARRQDEIDDLFASICPPVEPVVAADDKSKKRVAKPRYRKASIAGERAGERAGMSANLNRSGSQVRNQRGLGA